MTHFQEPKQYPDNEDDESPVHATYLGAGISPTSSCNRIGNHSPTSVLNKQTLRAAHSTTSIIRGGHFNKSLNRKTVLKVRVMF